MKLNVLCPYFSAPTSKYAIYREAIPPCAPLSALDQAVPLSLKRHHRGKPSSHTVLRKGMAWCKMTCRGGRSGTECIGMGSMGREWCGMKLDGTAYQGTELACLMAWHVGMEWHGRASQGVSRHGRVWNAIGRGVGRHLIHGMEDGGIERHVAWNRMWHGVDLHGMPCHGGRNGAE